MLLRRLAFVAVGLALATPAFAETIDIAVGHQSMCTDTYTAGIIVKELGLLEKHLTANTPASPTTLLGTITAQAARSPTKCWPTSFNSG
jgi:hypothetical protein